MNPIDRLSDKLVRALAQRTSRRSMLARVGSALVGAAAVPLLPVARAGAEIPDGKGVPPTTSANPKDDPGNPRSCDYWRYCAIDGFLCACCGGSANACPPGSLMSPVTWIGTCENPANGKHYVISYNDCCGKQGCKRCFCNRNEREAPEYWPQKNNEIHWCLGTPNTSYVCSVAVVIGTALEEEQRVEDP
ncbi:MAG: methylamine dehydrogenase (amicyanin) light chain [bacterium]|nr:methylamine dehydrogenase (amicyanin) light chain [bacterium]